MQMLQEAIGQAIKERFTKKKEGICKKLSKCCNRKKTSYVNQYPIDEFVDYFWLLNCPEHLSVQKTYEKVETMIH